MTQPRSHRRLDRPREQVLEAALAMIAEDGLAKVTMAALGKRLGTSGGHLLYYFGTRNRLLLETVRWSEKRFAEDRRPLVSATARPATRGVDRVVRFAEVYLPKDDRDPRWLLWLELWARAPYDVELADAQHELDDEWHADLVTVLAREVPELPDVDGTSERLRAMWDGFAMAIVTGGGRKVRRKALRHTRAMLTAP